MHKLLCGRFGVRKGQTMIIYAIIIAAIIAAILLIGPKIYDALTQKKKEAAEVVEKAAEVVEKGKMREAEANLYTMHMAEKMYELDNPTIGYIDCGPGLTACNTILRIEMSEEYFENWACNATDGIPAGDGVNNAFTCQAERVSGRYDGCIVSIDQTGSISKINCSN